jgi:AcrR family transcriptional regulator
MFIIYTLFTSENAMSATTTARGDRARDEILSAARWVLLERGIEGLTLREVARRANYSPAALYNHFADKDALVAAVAMECLGTLSRYLGSVPADPAPERLIALGLAYAAFAAENPAEYAVIFDCLPNPPSEWEHYVEFSRPFAVIVKTCEQGLAEGTLVDIDGVGASGMAYALWTLAHGHIHLQAKHLAHVSGSYDGMFLAGLRTIVRGMAPLE